MTDPPNSATLLVVGSRGAGQHSGSILGSTSLELVETATTPVVVVPMATDLTVGHLLQPGLSRQRIVRPEIDRDHRP